MVEGLFGPPGSQSLKSSAPTRKAFSEIALYNSDHDDGSALIVSCRYH